MADAAAMTDATTEHGGSMKRKLEIAGLTPNGSVAGAVSTKREPSLSKGAAAAGTKRPRRGSAALSGAGASQSQSQTQSPADDVPDFLAKLEALDADHEKAVAPQELWPRRPLPAALAGPAGAVDLVFQQIEIEDDVRRVPPQMPNPYGLHRAPSLRLYGVTDDGNAVVAHVFGFHPYLWVPAPPSLRPSDLPDLCAKLNNVVMGLSRWGHHAHSTAVDPEGLSDDLGGPEPMRRPGSGSGSGSGSGAGSGANDPAVLEILMDTNQRSIFHYTAHAIPYLKIICNTMDHLRATRKLCEQGTPLLNPHGTMTYESTTAFPLRYMIDTGIVGCSWLTFPKGTWYRTAPNERGATVQLEVDVHWKSTINHGVDGPWSRIAPLRIFSFDIECGGRRGVFPEAQIDPIIQIANMVTRQGENYPFIRNIFTLKSCSSIPGSHVMSFENEADMLCAWADFFRTADPDIVTGYNTQNFDFPYLLDRAEALKIAHRFSFLGRMRTVKTEAKTSRFSSKAFGTRESRLINTEGRIQFDVLQVMLRDHKLRSYSLNSVSYHFLGEQKEDVHHSIISDLQNGNEETRRRLAVYCLKDAYLPQRLLDKLMCIINYTEMARVTGVPLNYLLTRGQQIKVLSQLHRKAQPENFLIPNLPGQGTDDQYEGAIVIEPEKGFYADPVATLDFNSLYPSIMQAHNLCYTTYIPDDHSLKRNGVEPGQYVITPNKDRFVTADVRKGLLPTILEDLLSARKRAKADLKRETDPFKRAVLDGRQLALKVSANSVYGFTGATVGKLPLLAISSSVTAYGREMIEATKAHVEQQFTRANGYATDAKVIYGDTDSVMVLFGTKDIKEAMRLGNEAAVAVTKTFKRPINLEFEKVYWPYLLINKKRYAGLYWTNPDKADKMDCKGIETVRRDSCALVSKVINTSLHKILIDRDIDGAEQFVKSTIRSLLNNRIDLSDLVISKSLGKSEYAGKQAHNELAERMRKRDAGSAPAQGDRVAYVIVRGARNAAAYEKAEDPIYVLENNLPIDTKYYLENQLSKPLLRIFEPILGPVKSQSLLSGDHTRGVTVAAPTTGGLMKFAVKTFLCPGCKTPLKKTDGVVCQHCRTQAPQLYMKQLRLAREAEERYARLWTQCQRCQGSLHQDVICTSQDCPIFYMRKKSQKDVSTAMAALERFDTSW